MSNFSDIFKKYNNHNKMSFLFPHINTYDYVIPNSFILAIKNIKKSFLKRHCRSLSIKKCDFDKLVVNNDEGCALVYGHGGGICNWYLVNYDSKLYFIFSFYDQLSARNTDINELIYLLSLGSIINNDNTESSFDDIYKKELLLNDIEKDELITNDILPKEFI